ncbi:hypothetical protein GCM10029978_023720 [Actinoallomurus acanthiterrae]
MKLRTILLASAALATSTIGIAVPAIEAQASTMPRLVTNNSNFDNDAINNSDNDFNNDTSGVSACVNVAICNTRP